jgi:hypothetical protein
VHVTGPVAPLDEQMRVLHERSAAR